jgi:hypothetical protein
VGRADTASWQNCRRDGVAFRFQVISDFVQPSKGNRRSNVFSKDSVRATLADEARPYRPEVARVGFAFLTAGLAEGLAGATSGPNRLIVWYSRESKSVGPAGNACKEVALGEAFEVDRFDILNIPFVHFTGRNMASGNQIAKPVGRERVMLVVVGWHPSMIPQTLAARQEPGVLYTHGQPTASAQYLPNLQSPHPARLEGRSALHAWMPGR